MIETLEDLTAHVLAHDLRFSSESVRDIPSLCYWLWKMNIVEIVDIHASRIRFNTLYTFWYDHGIRSVSIAYVGGVSLNVVYSQFDKKYGEMKREWKKLNR